MAGELRDGVDHPPADLALGVDRAGADVGCEDDVGKICQGRDLPRPLGGMHVQPRAAQLAADQRLAKRVGELLHLPGDALVVELRRDPAQGTKAAAAREPLRDPLREPAAGPAPD